jgi:hypothetical protein
LVAAAAVAAMAAAVVAEEEAAIAAVVVAAVADTKDSERKKDAGFLACVFIFCLRVDSTQIPLLVYAG